jgi:hypothetical protein
MFAKLNVIVIGTLIAAPACAGQPNSRDGTFEGSEPSPRPPASTVFKPVPCGRDSVYVTGAGSKTPKQKSSDVVYKPGRS